MHHDCFHHSCEQSCTSIRSGESSCPPLQVIIIIHKNLPHHSLPRVGSASPVASAQVVWSERGTPALNRLTAQIVSAGWLQ